MILFSPLIHCVLMVFFPKIVIRGDPARRGLFFWRSQTFGCFSSPLFPGRVTCEATEAIPTLSLLFPFYTRPTAFTSQNFCDFFLPFFFFRRAAGALLSRMSLHGTPPLRSIILGGCVFSGFWDRVLGFLSAPLQRFSTLRVSLHSTPPQNICGSLPPFFLISFHPSVAGDRSTPNAPSLYFSLLLT